MYNLIGVDPLTATGHVVLFYDEKPRSCGETAFSWLWRRLPAGSGVIISPDGSMTPMQKRGGFWWVNIEFRGGNGQCEEKSHNALAASTGNVSKKLQHQRFCHIWQSSCRCGDCEDCAASKAQAPSHSAERPPELKSTKYNENLHVDTVGPIAPRSYKGFRWLMTTIDDATEFACCYPMKKKSDAHKAIEQHIEIHGAPEQIRADNGTEFAKLFKQRARREGVDVVGM